MSSVRERHDAIADRIRAAARDAERGKDRELAATLADLADQVSDLGIAMEHRFRQARTATAGHT